MKKLALTILALGLALPLASTPDTAEAQSEILADLYGQGVHAHYAGKSQEAYDHFSMAINNGIEDPRAFYFRGIAASAIGRQYEAESDWQRGAELEARGKMVGSIGRSLARFQGPNRIKLEVIRQKAKLDFLAQAAMRSKARYGEIQSTQGDMLRSRPLSATPIAPPPAPLAADENPFSDEMGEPAVDSDDALEGAFDAPPADDVAPPVVDEMSSEPSKEDSDGGEMSDPFSTDSDPFSDDSSDPFAGDDSDPFSN